MPTISIAGNPKVPFLVGLWQLFRADSASYAYAAHARLHGRGASCREFSTDDEEGGGSGHDRCGGRGDRRGLEASCAGVTPPGRWFCRHR